jgi:hypothetical protein
LTPEKKRRLGTAVGFLSGVLACTDALHDARMVWPVDAMWAGLRNMQRVEFAGGALLVLVTLIVSIAKKTS